MFETLKETREAAKRIDRNATTDFFGNTRLKPDQPKITEKLKRAACTILTHDWDVQRAGHQVRCRRCGMRTSRGVETTANGSTIVDADMLVDSIRKDMKERMAKVKGPESNVPSMFYLNTVPIFEEYRNVLFWKKFPEKEDRILRLQSLLVVAPDPEPGTNRTTTLFEVVLFDAGKMQVLEKTVFSSLEFATEYMSRHKGEAHETQVSAFTNVDLWMGLPNMPAGEAFDFMVDHWCSGMTEKNRKVFLKDLIAVIRLHERERME